MDEVVMGGFVPLALVAAALHYYNSMYEGSKKEGDDNGSNNGETSVKTRSVSNPSFVAFQRQFFVVYFLALLGDWLQGPYVYQLYAYYGFSESRIAVLYVAGFASSVCLGTFTGPMADLLGRRRMALLFSLFYTLCCLTKLSSNYMVLLLGRLLGGISTSMLFSTFEAWYVYEHVERHGFPAEWMALTFAKTTFYNGLIAIFAGVLSNLAAEALAFGPVAPFVMATLPLILCGVFVARYWNENYGSSSGKVRIMASCGEGLRYTLKDAKIFLLGAVQTAVESCMYIFVFLWTPILAPVSPPLGMVFACFMLMIMIGSSLHALLMAKKVVQAHKLLELCLVLLMLSLALCSLFAAPNASYSELLVVYLSFLLLELAIGLYFPSIAYCKSLVIPESHRANVMNWFRVPMNVITCATLLALHSDSVAQDKRSVFFFCTAMAALGWSAAKAFSNRLEASSKEQTMLNTNQA